MISAKSTKALLLGLFLAGSLTQPVTLVAGKKDLTSMFTDLSAPKKAALVAGAVTAFVFFSTEPNNDKPRISWDEFWNLISSPSALYAGFTKDTKNTFAKFWYVYKDLIVGSAHESSSIKADKESGKLLGVKEGSKPKGLIGNAHAYMKPFKSTIYALAAMAFLFNTDKDLFNTGLEKLDVKDAAALTLLFQSLSGAI